MGGGEGGGCEVELKGMEVGRGAFHALSAFSVLVLFITSYVAVSVCYCYM